MRKIVFTVLMMFFSVFASLAQDVSGWSGSGTASNPYQLATRADLELLATRVNAYNVSNGGTEASPMYRAYKGLYFKLTGDIDLLDSVFEPIGNSYNHAFAGTLDGGATPSSASTCRARAMPVSLATSTLWAWSRTSPSTMPRW